MNNIIFYFSGTGNSLKVAKSISQGFGNAEIVSMGNSKKYVLTKQYDTVGFVYPVYFGGLPNVVKNFVENIDLTNSVNSYFYGVATFGVWAANGIPQLNELLVNKHNVRLNYGKVLKMFSNYIVMYKMSDKINEITKKSNKNLVPTRPVDWSGWLNAQSALSFRSLREGANSTLSLCYGATVSRVCQSHLSERNREVKRTYGTPPRSGCETRWRARGANSASPVLREPDGGQAVFRTPR